MPAAIIQPPDHKRVIEVSPKIDAQSWGRRLKAPVAESSMGTGCLSEAALPQHRTVGLKPSGSSPQWLFQIHLILAFEPK